MSGEATNPARVEAALERIWIAAEGATLRREERRKAKLLSAILDEVARAVATVSRRGELCLVDAAAGKSYVGLLAAELVLGPARRAARVVAIEREPARVASSRAAGRRALTHAGIRFEAVAGAVGDSSLWPDEPAVVVALHACGSASDETIDRAIASRARHVLLVPCCTSKSVRGAAAAKDAAAALGIPRQAGVRRPFVEAWIAALRTLRLEAAGYETEVVAIVPPEVTPYGVLFRARLVGEPVRMRAAEERLETLGRPAVARAVTR